VGVIGFAGCHKNRADLVRRLAFLCLTLSFIASAKNEPPMATDAPPRKIKISLAILELGFLNEQEAACGISLQENLA